MDIIIFCEALKAHLGTTVREVQTEITFIGKQNLDSGTTQAGETSKLIYFNREKNYRLPLSSPLLEFHGTLLLFSGRSLQNAMEVTSMQKKQECIGVLS